MHTVGVVGVDAGSGAVCPGDVYKRKLGALNMLPSADPSRGSGQTATRTLAEAPGHDGVARARRALKLVSNPYMQQLLHYYFSSSTWTSLTRQPFKARSRCCLATMPS